MCRCPSPDGRLGLVTEATSLRRAAMAVASWSRIPPRSCYRGNFVEACHDQEPLPDGFGLGLVTEATSLRRTSETCSDVVVFPQGGVNSDGDDLDQIVQTDEIIRISCDQRQFLSHGNRCDQQVGKALARLTSAASDGGEDLSVGTRRGDSEGYGLEGCLDSLEPILPASPPAQPAAVPYWPVDTGCARALR